MSDPSETLATAAEQDAEAAQIYAPPRDEPLAPPPLAASAPAQSPVLLGFLTLLITTAISSAVAAGLMSFWYGLTPIRPGFLSGLEETIMAVLGWIALSAFALLGGVAMAAGLLGSERRVSGTGKVLTVLLAVVAAAVCFLPSPESTFALRGVLGLFSEAVTLALTHAALTYARRRYLPPLPVE